MRSRFRLCRSCGDIHQVGRWPHNCQEPRLDLRSDFPAPMIMNSTLDDGRGHGVINPVDGKRYANRRQFEAEVQAHGCSIMGTDRRAGEKQRPTEISDADVVSDIKRSLEELNSMSESERSNMMAAQDVASADEMAAAGL